MRASEPTGGVLPDPTEHPLSPLSVLVDVGLGGRSTIYARARNGQLPVEVIPCGSSYRVRTIDVYHLTGLPLPASLTPSERDTATPGPRWTPPSTPALSGCCPSVASPHPQSVVLRARSLAKTSTAQAQLDGDGKPA